MSNFYFKILTLTFLIGFSVFIPQIGLAQKEYASLVCVQKDGKYGILDDEGKEVFPCKFDQASSFSEGWIALKEGKSWAYYDGSGNKVLDLKKRFAFCGDFYDGLAFVSSVPIKKDDYNSKKVKKKIPKKIQFINRKGEVIFDVKNEWEINYKSLIRNEFSDGMLKVQRDAPPDSYKNIFGYLDNTGQLVIPFKFRAESNATERFSEKNSNQYNRNGQVIKFENYSLCGAYQYVVLPSD